MSKKPDINDITTIYNSANIINTNFDNVRESFDNTLSRDGSTPNEMNSDLDMSDNALINVGSITSGGVDLTQALEDAVQASEGYSASAEGFRDEAEVFRDEAEVIADSVAVSFPSRSLLVSAVSGGKDWPDGTIVSDGTVEYICLAGETVISDLHGLKPFGDTTPLHFSENTTPGTTDMTSAVRNSVGYGDTKIKGSGVTSITYTSPILISTRASGESGSHIQYTTSETGTSLAFNASDGAELDGISLTMVAGGSSSTGQFINAADNLNIRNVVFDGGVTEVEGGVSHISHAITFDSGDADNISVVGNTFKNLGRVVLKASTSTTEMNGFLFSHNLVENFYSEALAFNNPSGTLRGVRLLGNFSRNGFGSDVGSTNHIFGGAGVEGFVGVGNYHYGTGGEHFHLEEGTKHAAWVGNSGFMENSERAVSFSDNNVGGSGFISVEQVAVVGNVYERGSVGGQACYDFAPNNVGIEPAKETLVANNVAKGWERGIRTAERPMHNLVSGNILSGNNKGTQMMRPSLMVHDNLNIDNVVDVDLQTGGLIGHQYFAPTAAWDGSTNLVPNPMTALYAGTGGMDGWTMEYQGLDMTSGGVNYLMIPLGAHMSGDLTIAVSVNNLNYRFVHFRPVWDGTTLTQNLVTSYGSGISLVDIRDDGAGNLAVRLALGAPFTNARFQATFKNGFHILA